jgi:nucleoside-diphosphate-sugar epimerase
MLGLTSRPYFLPAFRRWNALSGIRIGITGHRGTLGSLLGSRLGAEGIEFSAFPGDVSDEQEMLTWIADVRPDVLFHLAAIVPVRRVLADPVAAMLVNAVSNLFVIGAIAKHAPTCWLFYSSTSHVYAATPPEPAVRISESAACEPSSMYGATKLAGEQILSPIAQHFRVNTCIGRIFSYFHESQSTMFLVPGLMERVAQAEAGGTLEVSDSNSVRDLLHADYIIDAMFHLCVARYSGTVNIGSGEGRRVGDMANQIASLSGKNLTVRHICTDRPTSLVASTGRLQAIISGSGGSE